VRDGWLVDVHAIIPLRSRPFPWRARMFLDELPETVLEVPEAIRIEPALPSATEHFGATDAAATSLPSRTFDAVILAAPVWFLAPSRPLTSFLASDGASHLRGVRVVCLLTCRNMWQNAALTLTRRLASLGAGPTACVCVTDRTQGFISFVNTPLWLLTGKRRRALLPSIGLTEAGVATAVTRVKSFLSAAPLHPSPLHPSFVGLSDIDGWFWPERVGAVLWKGFATLLSAAGRKHPVLRRALLFPCAFAMIAAILCLVPPLRILGRPLLRFASVLSPRTRARIAEIRATGRTAPLTTEIPT